ncbi:MAG: PEP-CTERM sorting domain-containing protein [Okeania sp. SIO2G4]|uniref:nidogen-like domain-containing protein n=1 Tax=unclassified Okeania TaxID=2634635 RepID=UPI0013BD835A|nr:MULTISPECIES: nidogen-like domain-containing protein [unclassified Okeania]NEP03947.1 PEP-CTERM sorting domain-containing protein [Okeania sp. SIO4D6]NEP73895.1 PEP-CTERM sorting domain-containing protein [Okeania sp. SIO2G5]NEP94708.1 PEP-CTERM sorting domain-containing protein [Okeania sp. SIO2F5]NEQ92433.1 PEP-CTERM sorting domain-containing protein [Okeania sp. SIO2G4]
MLKKLSIAAAGATLATLTAVSSANAAAIRSGFDSNTLQRNDDGSTGQVSIGFDVDFYGIMFDQLFVNNNGNITFDSALSSFTPFDLTSTGQQIIAPFFGDVDTRGPGEAVTYGSGTVDGRAAFGVNWVDVGFFSQNEPLNSFQLVLIDRSETGAGNFDFEFNYDEILWEAGTFSGGNSQGLGGNSARAGFSNGTGNEGTFFELDGSAVNGAFLDGGSQALVSNSLNSDVLGRYVFSVRDGEVEFSDQVSTPEPASILGLLAISALGATSLKRKRKEEV